MVIRVEGPKGFKLGNFGRFLGFRIAGRWRWTATNGGERWPEVFDGRDSREKRELLSLEKIGQGFWREKKQKKIKKKAEQGL